jgi:ribosome biogenesis protein ERB1
MLKGHEIKHKVGITCCEFHPKQPWIVTAGADKNIFLYTN